MTQNVGAVERFASATAGAAALTYGLRSRDDNTHWLMLAMGGGLLYRAITGKCSCYAALGLSSADRDHAMLPTAPIHIEKSVTINRSPEEMYQFWRTLENLPRFMEHLVRVDKTGEKTSHWTARSPLGGVVEWDAEITEDIPNQRIVWRAQENTDIQHGGYVEFQPASQGQGTEIKVRLQYKAPGGQAGALLAKLYGEEPGQQVASDLRRLKQLLETGEIATVAGQPSGRAS